MKKPEGCLYPDCLNCILDDCYYDKEEQEEEIIQEIGELEVFLENLRSTKEDGTRIRDNKLYKKTINRKNYLMRKIFEEGISYEER